MHILKKSTATVPMLIFAAAICVLILLVPAQKPTAISAVTGLEPGAEQRLDIDCVASEDIALVTLARAIENSMGDRPYVLRVAFGAVIVNRVRSDSFGGSVSAVLGAAGLYPSDTVKPSDRSLRAAKDALGGIDPTFGALYMLPNSDPSAADYSNRVLSKIGDHLFIG